MSEPSIYITNLCHSNPMVLSSDIGRLTRPIQSYILDIVDSRLVRSPVCSVGSHFGSIYLIHSSGDRLLAICAIQDAIINNPECGLIFNRVETVPRKPEFTYNIATSIRREHRFSHALYNLYYGTHQMRSALFGNAIFYKENSFILGGRGISPYYNPIDDSYTDFKCEIIEYNFCNPNI